MMQLSAFYMEKYQPILARKLQKERKE